MSAHNLEIKIASFNPKMKSGGRVIHHNPRNPSYLSFSFSTVPPERDGMLISLRSDDPSLGVTEGDLLLAGLLSETVEDGQVGVIEDD